MVSVKDVIVNSLILTVAISSLTFVIINADIAQSKRYIAEQKAVKWIQANCNKGSKLVASRNDLRRVYTCNGTDYTLSMLTSQFMENEK